MRYSRRMSSPAKSGTELYCELLRSMVLLDIHFPLLPAMVEAKVKCWSVPHTGKHLLHGAKSKGTLLS